MNPVLVTPAGLPLVWPFVVRSLNAVRRKTRDTYSDGEVFTELFHKRAFLWIDRATDPQMLGILTPADGELHIWISANFGPPSLVAEAVAWVRDQQRQHGFARITFDSPRKGWAKHFRVKKFTYEV
jgi:hypothetical protein